MLTVVITSMPASSSSWTSCQRLAWVEPGTLVWASSSTSATSRMPGQHSVDVELGEARPPVGQHPPGDDLQAVEQLGDARPAVRFDEADDDVGAPGEPAPALVEHRVGLADAGGRAEVDPQLTPRHRAPFLRGGVRLGGYARRAVRVLAVEGEVEVEHVDRGLTEEAQRPAVRVGVDQALDLGDRGVPDAGDPGCLQLGVGGADVGVEAAAAGRHRVGGHDRVGGGVALDRGDEAGGVVLAGRGALDPHTLVVAQERAGRAGLVEAHDPGDRAVLAAVAEDTEHRAHPVRRCRRAGGRRRAPVGRPPGCASRPG